MELFQLVLSLSWLVVSYARAVPFEIVTSDTLSYKFIDAYGYNVGRSTSIVFTVRATNDAHLAFFERRDVTKDDAYEVVIGGWENQRSVIRRCIHCRPKVFMDHSPLNGTLYRAFWVSWAGGVLRTGNGSRVHENEFLAWTDPAPKPINYVAVSTGWGAIGSWGFNFIDGGWSSWSEWSQCQVTCGGATQLRHRVCDNPVPVYGRCCPGDPVAERDCNTADCPVDGDWSTWSTWSMCSVTCGEGSDVRNRSCSNPFPRGGGRNCTGSSLQLRSCRFAPCKVDGEWGSWSSWDECPVSCGAGLRRRSRKCDSPLPNNEGEPCSGNDWEESPCDPVTCPVSTTDATSGTWSSWSEWSSCSRSCDGGKMQRQRSCHQSMSHQTECPGRETEDRGCNLNPCPVLRSDGDKPVEAPGAVGIGILGLIMICIFIVFIIILDLLTLPRHCDIMRRNIASACGKRERRRERLKRERNQVYSCGNHHRLSVYRRDSSEMDYIDELSRRRKSSSGSIREHAQNDEWTPRRARCGEVGLFEKEWSVFVVKRKRNVLRNDLNRLLRTPCSINYSQFGDDCRILAFPSTRL